MSSSGKLVLVATPIGNLQDLSNRASEELRDADLWLVEDTRVSGKLQGHLGVKKPMKVLNEHTSDHHVQAYLRDLQGGARYALLSDGGTPGVSDPGAHLTDRCHEHGVDVEAIPGPSAVLTALMLSGFYAQRFAFLGFLPRKPGPMGQELAPFEDSTYTLVLFESPHRVDKLMAVAYEKLGPRRYAICREMTKIYEQVVRGTLPKAPPEDVLSRKGEFSLVIEGKRKAKSAD